MWFTENPWPPILLGAVLFLIILRLWQQRQQQKFLIAAVGMLLVCAGIWFVERSIVTPTETIRSAIHDMTSAFQQRDTVSVFPYISERASQLKMLVTVADNHYRIGDDMRVTDVQVQTTANDSRATAIFRVNATVGLRSGQWEQHTPTRWESKWELEQGAWKMYEIHAIDPLTGERDAMIDQYISTVPNFMY